LKTLIKSGSLAYAFAERQFILTKRYWMWEMVFLIYSMSMTLSIGFLGANVKNLAGSDVNVQKLMLYLLTGSLLWGYLSVIFWDISNIISWERWEGTIEYTFMAPVSRATHILGVCAYTIIYSLIRTGVILAAVALFFRLNLSEANFLGVLVVLLVANFSFIGLGTIVAVMPLLSPEKGAQITGIVEGILLLVSGVYYEISVLPDWMQFFSRLSPATYALEGMRQALLDGAGPAQLTDYLVPLAIMGVILIPLGFWIFSVAEKYCKRTGRLKRSG
jgi:ABC-2 type transport system permease protein